MGNPMHQPMHEFMVTWFQGEIDDGSALPFVDLRAWAPDPEDAVEQTREQAIEQAPMIAQDGRDLFGTVRRVYR